MQDDIDPVSGQPIPVVSQREQYALAERMVDYFISPGRREFVRQVQLERRQMDAEGRPNEGSCLLCGTYCEELVPGRVGGWHVYCDMCALIPRPPAVLEDK
jgi:hypothetical protein